ncbi:hypothetical protein EGW08_009293, partial [Elysia chlorotica]
PRRTPCSNKASDIVFAVDSSFSIHPIDFTEQLNFLMAVLDQLPFGPDQFKVGVLTFASEVKLEIKFDQFKHKWDLRKAIGKIKHLEGGTNTQDALNFVRTKMFTPEFGARLSARKQLVIITDGRSMNESATVEEAGLAKDQGIEIFSIAVAIGPGEDGETRSMASEPKSRHVFKVGDYKALAAIASSVSGAACDGEFDFSCVDLTGIPISFSFFASSACKESVLEILFLLDSSTSMWATDFQRMVAFTKEVTESLDIANDRTRVGVIVYSDRPVTLLSLKDEQNQDNLRKVLNKAPYVTGRTDTAYVIKHARTEGFSKSRPYVARIVVLLTDGESNDNKETLKQAKAAQDDGIGVFIVGIGKAVKKNLRVLSSDPESDSFVFHMQDTHKRFTVPMLLAERTCKEAINLAETPPSERCPETPSDVLFVYDSSALNRQHNNLVIRTISSVVASKHLTNPGALRVGVIREPSPTPAHLKSTASDIALSEEWMRKSGFRRRLDPRLKSKDANLHSLLEKARQNYFPADQWSLPENKKRRRVIVLFLDYTVLSKYRTYIAADMLKSHSDVEIAVVTLGKSFSERQATEMASKPTHTYIIKPSRKGQGRFKRIEEKIIKLLCR